MFFVFLVFVLLLGTPFDAQILIMTYRYLDVAKRILEAQKELEATTAKKMKNFNMSWQERTSMVSQKLLKSLIQGLNVRQATEILISN